MPSQFISPVRIELVSDPSDVPALASVFDDATRVSGDNFRELLKRYVEDPYTEVERHLRSALSPAAEASTQQHFVLKAVWLGDDGRRDEGNPGRVGRETRAKDTIAGMAHWSMGYINIPKVDPFERQSAPAPASVGADESTESAPLGQPIATAPEPEPSFDFSAVCRRPVRNTYISHIQGKKHLYLHRIAVHPEYQRRGIARQLLQWGLDLADSEALVSYLNGRPHARLVYEKAGFTAVDVVPLPVPGLEVADMIAMIRQPQQVSGR